MHNIHIRAKMIRAKVSNFTIALIRNTTNATSVVIASQIHKPLSITKTTPSKHHYSYMFKNPINCFKIHILYLRNTSVDSCGGALQFTWIYCNTEYRLLTNRDYLLRTYTLVPSIFRSVKLLVFKHEIHQRTV